MYRRFANLWETSQSLFWASFGLVELGDFDLTGIQEFTRFWGLLMFGSYSVCNIIVLLNMLIAMMSNSYTNISARADVEWKFARSKLWISYFEEGRTVPPPFNMVPTAKSILRFLKCSLCKDRTVTYTEEESMAADSRYYGVMRCLVRRYITHEQRKSENTNITEDDINEVIIPNTKCRIWILAIFTNFCPIKTDMSGNTVWPQPSGLFQKLPKLTVFGIFDYLLFTQNVKLRSLRL